MTELNLLKTHKRLYAAAGALELAGAGLPKKEKLLVKLRASFENNCHFCINMHSKEALKLDFSQAWVDAIAQWPTSRGEFDGRENLILEFTTAGTRLIEGFEVELQERVISEFGEKFTGDLIGAIATINMWNRIGVLCQK
ncbi:carboxymuconolactone decarboxylase family protein [Corynebacterium sp. A21]|uniref:carboxymuconolactone decarboxylase family protein n=1 Tax=Corynebacterium sp. A21 TaxID=3457318 RepID=UPI003FCFC60F